MQDIGLVSIIMPSYNSSAFIGEAIESVLSQTYKNWELLITDDASTDKSRDIISHYCNKDERIKLFCLSVNSGAGIARNNSIEQAQGKYMAFLDSDDLWLPYKLERQLSFMFENNISISYTSSLTCYEDGKIFAFNPAYRRVSFRQICNCDKCGTTELMYNVSKLGKVLMPPLRKRQDWAFKIILIQKEGYAYGMFDTLSIYRIRHNSLSRNKFKLIKFNVQVYRKILHHSTIMAWARFLFIFTPSYLMKKTRQKIANSSL